MGNFVVSSAILAVVLTTKDVEAFAPSSSSSSPSSSSSSRFLLGAVHRHRSSALTTQYVLQTALNAVSPQAYGPNHLDGGSGDSDLVLDDFDDILEAIRIFSSVHGDLVIPTSFEVPDQDPWPRRVQGLRLGRRLDKLLRTDEFFTKHSDKVAQLAKTGFHPSVASLADDWRIIIDALKVYKEVYGDVNVQAKFEVPNEAPWPRHCRNVKLGVRVSAMRSAGRYVKDHPSRKEELDKLDFVWRMRDKTHKQQVADAQFDLVVQALATYKELAIDGGDVNNVPRDFVVPSLPEWPTATHGVALGTELHAIRDKNRYVNGFPEREKRLTEFGLELEEDGGGRNAYSKKRFDIVYGALVAYKRLYGDVNVPPSFSVPNDDPEWPEEAYGLKLGARVAAIRSQGTLVSNSPERRGMLDDLGFSWDMKAARRTKKKGEEDSAADAGRGATGVGASDDILSALGLKRTAVDGGSGVGDVGGLVDEAGAVKQRLAGLPSMPLGGVSGGGFVDDQRPVLSYDPTRMFEPLSYREIAAETVREYMQDREYSADPDVRRWAHFEGHLTPEDYHRVTTRGIPDEDIKAMKKIGYRIFEFGRFNWDNIVSGLTAYKAIHGHVDVPHEFVVDDAVLGDAGSGFDERFEGMRLGEAVAGLRVGDIDGLEDTTRRKTLDALGFVWGDKAVYQRYRFVPMLMGLKLYKHLYGFPMPQYNFVVPDEPQWPYWMVNMPLGEWSAVARVQQKMIAEHYPHRRDMLNALEYLWWQPPGPLPAKYFRPLK
jgi:hypothetical protein